MEGSGIRWFKGVAIWYKYQTIAEACVVCNLGSDYVEAVRTRNTARIKQQLVRMLNGLTGIDRSMPGRSVSVESDKKQLSIVFAFNDCDEPWICCEFRST